MKNKLNRILCIGMTLVLLVTALGGCGSKKAEDNIVILYTNDVHGAVEDNIGYAGIAAYKKSMEAKTPYVTLVDCGDAVQGEEIDNASKGGYIIEIMNAVGYDLAVLGDHEFDYGVDNIAKFIEKSNAQYLATNVYYTGDYDDYLEKTVKYKIIEYGDVRVAYLGVTTPDALLLGEPSFFMEGLDYVYEFCIGDEGLRLAAHVQSSIDECKELGADYVILLSHLGDGEKYSPYSCEEVIANTYDVDVVIDGHAHSEIDEKLVKNKNGENVLVSSTGTKLQNIGELVITPDGEISTTLVSGYEAKDEEIQEFIDTLKSAYEADESKTFNASDDSTEK